MEHQVSLEVAPYILEGILGVVKLFLGKEMIAMMMSATAIAAFTYGILELFMKSQLNVQFPFKQLSDNERSTFGISVALVISAVLPFLIAIVPVFSARRPPSYLQTIRNLGIAAFIAVLATFIFSWILKVRLPKDKVRHTFLIPEALRIITDTFAEHLADWIVKLFIGAVNLTIKVVHKPFIMEYARIAVVINLIISVALVSIMGISNDAGRANLAGSVIGGLAHAIFRYKHIKALRAQYTAEAETLAAESAEKAKKEATHGMG